MGKSSKRRRTENSNGATSYADSSFDGPAQGLEYDENGLVPTGFTISFDDFDDRPAGGGRGSRGRRGRREQQDDDEDSSQQAPRGGYGSQVLPVALALPEGHSGDPEDGHEYLFLVRREAATHPGIITAEAFLQERLMAAKASLLNAVLDEPVASTSTASSTLPPPHRPTIEWRTSFLSRFTNMRQTLSHATPFASSSAIPAHYLPIPAAQDESSWRTYIQGRRAKGKQVASSADSEDTAGGASSARSTMLENLPSRGAGEARETGAMTVATTEDSSLSELTDHPSTGKSTEEPSSTQIDASKRWSGPRKPIPALMRSLDNYVIISLLEHIEGWLSERLEKSINESTPSTIFVPHSALRRKKKPPTAVAGVAAIPVQSAPLGTTEAVEVVKPAYPVIMSSLDSQWLFSLLAVLDNLLVSEEISTLRTLSKTCQKVANHLWTQQQKEVSKGGDPDLFSESIASCWMVSAGVWEVWGQRDLWEE